ncbi:hypothetical protein [Spiroplasma alleghenense]|uniref:Uncharacterized protein n=1 Tax=Spiroplasma alleghenense TaxID=216931 RepID=A0A345Z3B9_9MOLU|nr:hypothetical protein [Spiroplasma alleghenense]AXK51098.1 hypothetical protein SALLE_v1c04240 [Spiroplasma alleghenense]
MKKYLIIILMWLIIISSILCLNLIKIKIISKAIIIPTISENSDNYLQFICVEKIPNSIKNIYFFNEKGKKIVFSDFKSIEDKKIVVNNSYNYELPEDKAGFIYTGDETLLNYILKTIF